MKLEVRKKKYSPSGYRANSAIFYYLLVIRRPPYIRLLNYTGKEIIFRQLLIHISKQYTTLYSNRQRTIPQFNRTKE